ncbi:MAG: thioredoxin family protein [Bacteroidales bacterium]
MAETPSKMRELGFIAPDFTLPDTLSGKPLSLQELRSDQATVIMFICNHCPFVKHVNDELVRLANDYIPKGISFIAISSNDAESYPEDSPEKMAEYGKRLGYPFPYLYDETQEVARKYDAACTPDFFIFDRELKCVYRGQLDDSRPSNGKPVTGKDIRNALDAFLSGRPVNPDQKPGIGCNIKWKN